MFKKLLSIALGIWLGASAHVTAGPSTQLQWGIDKTNIPYNVQMNINGAWSSIGTVSAGGAFIAAGVPAFACASNSFLRSLTYLGAPSCYQATFPDITGMVSPSQLPYPTSTTIGGVNSTAPVSHLFATGISTLGVVTTAQPAFSDLSGLLAAGQLPATPTFTGLTGYVSCNGASPCTASSTIPFSAAGIGTGNNATANAFTATNQALFLNGTYTGTGIGPYAEFSVADTSTQSGYGFLTDVRIDHNVVTGAGQGNRAATQSILNMNAPTAGAGSGSGYKFYTSSFAQTYINSPDCGTGCTPGSIQGDYYAGRFLAQANEANYAGLGYPGAGLLLNGIRGTETGVSLRTGTAAGYKQIASFISVNGDASRGTLFDSMLSFLRDGTTSATWSMGLSFGRPDGLWPFATDSTIIGSTAPISGSRVANHGVDFSGVTFTSDAFKSNGFSIDPNGVPTFGLTGNIYCSGSSPCVPSASPCTPIEAFLTAAQIADARSGALTLDLTTPLQNFFNSFVTGGSYCISSGSYKFTSPLSVPNTVSEYTITGVGNVNLVYAGANTTNDLLTLGHVYSGTTNYNTTGVQLNNFHVLSNTTMTAGYAIRMQQFDNSWVTNVDCGINGNKVWNCLFFDGVHQVTGDVKVSGARNDGIEARAVNATSAADLWLKGFSDLNGGSGVHISGGLGGVFIDNFESLGNQYRCYLFDAANQTANAVGNRELILGPNAVCDGLQSSTPVGIELNDPNVNGSTFISFALIGSATTDGIWVHQWPYSFVNLSGGQIFNNLRDGVRIDNTPAILSVGSGTIIRNNSAWGINSIVTMTSQSRVDALFGSGGAANGTGNMAPNVFAAPVPTVASAATVTLPYSPAMVFSGTTTVTTMNTTNSPQQMVLMTNGSLSFATGGNICNAMTPGANVPVIATWIGGYNCWALK